LAVRFEAHPAVAKALPTWQGKTIVDVTNAYGVPLEQLGGLPSARQADAKRLHRTLQRLVSPRAA
jgi:predicted dinucleotide-binding enzyme